MTSSTFTESRGYDPDITLLIALYQSISVGLRRL